MRTPPTDRPWQLITGGAALALTPSDKAPPAGSDATELLPSDELEILQVRYEVLIINIA